MEGIKKNGWNEGMNGMEWMIMDEEWGPRGIVHSGNEEMNLDTTIHEEMVNFLKFLVEITFCNVILHPGSRKYHRNYGILE